MRQRRCCDTLIAELEKSSVREETIPQSSKDGRATHKLPIQKIDISYIFIPWRICKPQNRRQRHNKKHEIRKDVHSSQDHEDDIDLGTLRLDKGILFALNGPALEDDADDLDAAVFCHDKAGGP